MSTTPSARVFNEDQRALWNGSDGEFWALRGIVLQRNMKPQFETDDNGNVILKPVLGWTMTPVAEIFVLLRIDFADCEADIETGRKAIQFVLKPEKCLELARALTKQAKHLLEAKLPPGRSPN